MSPQITSSEGKIEFNTLGGTNTTDNYARVGETEVNDSDNLLWEKGMALARPGLGTGTIAFTTGIAIFADSIIINNESVNFVINNAGTMYNFTVATGFAYTGAGTLFANFLDNNICSALNTLLVGNNQNGLILIDDPINNPNYIVIPEAPYKYFASHQGRAVAAYDLTNTTNGPRAFGWCKPGDLTTWTSVDGSAGQEFIAECNDKVSGLGVLHNIVVILRTTGIHLGYPTGSLPLPYNLQPFTTYGAGCFYSSTAAWTDQFVIFCGQDDVYMFDLQQCTPIGYKIRDELMHRLNVGTNYRGVITRVGQSSTPRFRYHLFPINAVDQPHFVYDLLEQKWSKHSYNVPGNWPFDLAAGVLLSLPNSQDHGFAFVDGSTPTNVRLWDGNLACEKQMSFTRYMGMPGSLERDFKVTDILIRHKDLGVTLITITLEAQLNDTTQTFNGSKLAGSFMQTGKLIRTYLSRNEDMKAVGNDFLVTIVIGSNQVISMDYLVFMLAEVGFYRGY